MLEGWAGGGGYAPGELAAARGDVSMGWRHRKSMSRRIWARHPAREEDLDSPSMSRRFWTKATAREDPAHVRTDLDTPRPCGEFGRPMPCVQRFGQGNPAPWRFWTRPTEGTWEGCVGGWVGEMPEGSCLLHVLRSRWGWRPLVPCTTSPYNLYWHVSRSP